MESLGQLDPAEDILSHLKAFDAEVRAMRKKKIDRQQQILLSISKAYEVKMMKIDPYILNKSLCDLTREEIIEFIGDVNEVKSMEMSRNTIASKAKRTTRGRPTGCMSVRNNKFKTPLNQQIISTAGMVTPKFNPYAPMSVLRKPKEGEVAMSMSGSPLHVSSVINECKPNVVVPLQGGKILSVLPEKGLRMSELPEIDDELRQQLEVLNANIRKMLSKN